VVFGIALDYFIVYEAYFVVGEFFVELLGLCMFFCCLWLLFLFIISLGMSGHFGGGPLWS
jgi:hypothetical protein